MDVAYLLAAAHHLAVFALAAVLAAETALIFTGPLTAVTLARLGRLDLFYGLVALAVLAIGIARVFLGLKDWTFYAGNAFFWAKIAAFLAVGALSAPPTIAFGRWGRTVRMGGALPGAAEIGRVRRFVVAQWALLATVPLFAAALGQNH